MQPPPAHKQLYRPPYSNEPVKPFRIIGNIYYVGMRNYTSFLITTPQGHILLDTMSDPEATLIRQDVERLGFHLKDIKFLLQTHAHIDHVGGLAKLKELTGAKVLVMAQDVDVLADGGRSDFRGDGRRIWTPVRADRILHDGDAVEFGDVKMVAHLTAGHTKGCTTWTTVTEENGKKYNVVFVCSNRVNEGVPLLDNGKYPNMAEDFANGFKTLKSLPCDVFLASHAYMFNLDDKLKRLAHGKGPNPFIDPQGYRDYISDYENEFLYRVRLEQEGRQPAASRSRASSAR